MFTPIHLLPQYDRTVLLKYQNRWKTSDGKITHDKIAREIDSGKVKILQLNNSEFKKTLQLESQWDLKGFELESEHLNYKENGFKFESIDFAYSLFNNSVFENVTFESCSFVFSRFDNCQFINCTFLSSVFYAATFDQVKLIDCDFIENNRIRNCNFRDVKISDCFIENNQFFDCHFEERTRFGNLRPRSANQIHKKILNKKDIAEIYKGIKEGYLAGDVIGRSRQYYFKERQSITRHNMTDWPQKFGNYLLELISGYGVKPYRVFLTMIITFMIFSAIFISKLGFTDGFLMSVGAFFTNGANSSPLNEMGIGFQIIYILESFMGIALVTMLITVLANLWFREK